MRSGYFFVYRKLLDHEIAKNPLMVALWVRLLADANWEDTTIYFGKSTIPIKRGQLVTSVESLAKWLRVSRSTSKRHLNALQMLHQIDIKTTNKYVVITIRNYDKYQISGQQMLQQSEHQTIRQTNTENKYKNIKNIKNIRLVKKPTPQEVGRIVTKKRTEITYPKATLDDIVNYYVQKKGITPQGNEWLPIQQSVKTMLMNGRTPTEIEEFIYWLSVNWVIWDTRTLATRMPEFLAGKLDREKNKINKLVVDPLFIRYREIYHRGDDLAVRAKMAIQPKLEEKYPYWKYEREWEEARKLLKALPQEAEKKEQGEYEGMRDQLVQSLSMN